MVAADSQIIMGSIQNIPFNIQNIFSHYKRQLQKKIPPLQTVFVVNVRAWNVRIA